MAREVFLGFDRMVVAVALGIGMPARVARQLHERYGSRPFYVSITVAAVAAAFGFAADGIYELTQQQGWTNTETKINTISALIRNGGLLIAGLIGVGFGIWRAYTGFLQTRTAQEQARITEQGQITDRYTKAVEMLSDKNARTRVGAIYALPGSPRIRSNATTFRSWRC